MDVDADAGAEQCSLSWAEATALVLLSAPPCPLLTAMVKAVRIGPALDQLLVLERVQHSPALCLPFPELIWRKKVEWNMVVWAEMLA